MLMLYWHYNDNAKLKNLNQLQCRFFPSENADAGEPLH